MSQEVRDNFLSWAKAYKDQIRFSNQTERWVSGRWWAGADTFFMFKIKKL
jgi:hypothetical protein